MDNYRRYYITLTTFDENRNPKKVTDVTDILYPLTKKYWYEKTELSCGVYDKNTGKKEKGLITILKLY